MRWRLVLAALVLAACSSRQQVDVGAAEVGSTDMHAAADADPPSDTDCCVSTTQEFPQANDGITNLHYSAGHGVEACVDPEFVGEIRVDEGTLTAWVGEGAPTPVTRALTEGELANLTSLVAAVPPADLQMPHNCDPCLVRWLRVDGHEAAGQCCGVCNPDFLPAFDAVAAFLVALVPP